jgi:hypothetical protein
MEVPPLLDSVVIVRALTRAQESETRSQRSEVRYQGMAEWVHSRKLIS